MSVHDGLLGVTLTICAATDVVRALRPLIRDFEQSTQATVRLVQGSTGTLPQQIRNGAPADMFFAANDSFVDDLAKESLIQPASRTVYARGRLVLVQPKNGSTPIRTLKDLASGNVGRIAIANPAHAP